MKELSAPFIVASSGVALRYAFSAFDYVLWWCTCLYAAGVQPT